YLGCRSHAVHHLRRCTESRYLPAEPRVDVIVDGSLPRNQLATKLDGVLLGLDYFLGAVCGSIYCADFQGSQCSPAVAGGSGSSASDYDDLVFVIRIVSHWYGIDTCG